MRSPRNQIDDPEGHFHANDKPSALADARLVSLQDFQRLAQLCALQQCGMVSL